MISMNEVIEKAGELKPLSPTVCKLAGVVASENSTVDDIARLIQYDEALTVDVLKYANSAFSGSTSKISSVKYAVIRLGGARILEQIVARHVKDKINKPLLAYGYSEDELWRHSVAAATAAENMNNFIDETVGGISFTAALLHDIGKLLLGRGAEKEMMDKVWGLVSKENYPCDQAESKVFGFNHADIGARLMSEWGLPEGIVSVIQSHHTSNEDTTREIDCVRLANLIARSVGEGIGYEGMSLSIDDTIPQKLGLTRDNFEMLCVETKCRMTEIINMYQ